jgi:hypothetical protein
MKNRENHGFKTMGPKPWVENHKPKTMGVEYSRSLMKSLFYFIWFGLTMIYILYNFSWKKVEKTVVQNHDPKNHEELHIPLLDCRTSIDPS